VGDHGDLDGDHADGTDQEQHHGSNWFFSVLSFRSLVAFVAFFGLIGAALAYNGAATPVSFSGGVCAGVAALLVVAWLMRMLYQFNAEGTVRISRAVGMGATVYLSIPGHNKGAGKVTVKIQGRTMEYSAVTSGPDLPTGSPALVVGVVGASTLEVAAASNAEGD